MRSVLLCCWLFLPVIALHAQEWKNYTNSQGVTCVAADHDTIWVGSEGGVAKFLSDGTLLTTYTHADGLADNNVTAIAIDTTGNKWFGTETGISKFDSNNWATYNTNNSGLPNNSVNAVAVDKQNIIWIGSQGGLSKFDGNTFITYNSSNSNIPYDYVSLLAIDTQGNKWVYSLNNTILGKFDGANWSTIQATTSDWNVTSMGFDPHNNLWMGTATAGPGTEPGVSKFDGSTWQVYTYANTAQNFGDGHIAFDIQGNLWCDITNGVCEFDGAAWIAHIGGGGSLLCIDNSDNKWFDGDGLGKFDGVNWTAYNPSNSGLQDNFIETMTIDHHGNKWFDTYGNNVVKFDGDWSICPSGWPCSVEINSMIADHSDNIWASFGIDVLEFDGTNNIEFGVGSNNWPNDIAIDGTNNIWVATENLGIFHYDHVNWTSYDQSNSGLLSDHVNAIAVDSFGNKWAGTNLGVSKFDGNNWTNYTPANSGLIDSTVQCVIVDQQGNKWFGTAKGISKLNGTNWTNYDTANSGLVANGILAMMVDREGSIWFSCFGPYTNTFGVSKFDGANWTTYTTANSGLSNNEVFAMAVDKLDNKWFATLGGVSELTGTDSTYSVWLQSSGNICSNDTITLNASVNFGLAPFTYVWQSSGDSLSCYSCSQPTATITQNSVYSVAVTGSNGITVVDTLHVRACATTGIKSITGSNSISVYPNPTDDILYISGLSQNTGKLTLFDITGRSIYSFTPNGESIQTLDVSRLTRGVYLLGYQSSGDYLTIKIVKQ